MQAETRELEIECIFRFLAMSSELLEELAREGSVELESYGHQVGGHHLLFTFKDTLCKPVIDREHFFYQTAPPLLKPYIPDYHGTVSKAFSTLDLSLLTFQG